MDLFDRTERVRKDLPCYQEPSFSYLNQSNRIEAKRIREVLGSWFSRYPIGSQGDLQSRFRSSNDNEHISAFFELALHELLIKLGFSVRVHPKLHHTTRRPDFLASNEEGTQFFLEAVAITGETNSQAAERAQIYRIYDVVNRRVSSNQYFIGIEVRRRGKYPPKAKALSTFVEKKLNNTNFESIIRNKESLQSLKWSWNDAGWEIITFPISKARRLHNEVTHRIIGVSTEGVILSKACEQIRKTLLNKAGRYGKLPHPYIIAVNIFENFADNETIINALLGDEQFHFAQGSANKVVQNRKCNGVWTSMGGPRYTRLSGVLAFRRLKPWNIANTNFHLLYNPYVEVPFIGELNHCSHFKVDNDEYKLFEGRRLRELFRLPKGWPE